MAVNITATRTSTLFNDQDGDGVVDPGDVLLTRIRVTNLGDTDATGISVTDTLTGVTLVPGSVQVTPIAFDDFMPSITGNTPITFTSGQLLGNDVDPDGAEINITISGVSSAANGAIVNNGDGSFTFTPTTGYVGTASFQYTITDEQGLASVTTGIVSFTVTDPVWYVDASYSGVNGASDGSYLKPFTTLANLSTGGSADALDNADDTIFVYNSGTYSTGIVLETGQKLFGDGHAFSVNGLSIGANAANTTINHAGVGVTLSTNNTIMGVTLNGTANGAVGVEDGGASVGTFTMDESSITGLGKAVDIDQGGTLAVDLDQLSSASSTSEGVHLQGVTGSFAAATGIIQTSTGTGVLIGAAGGGTPSSGGDVNFTYGGDISSPGGSIVEIQDRTGGAVTFNGIITEGAINAGQTGILIDQNAGTVNFNGQTFVSAGAGTGNGVTISNSSGTVNFNPTGTGLDITTTSGTGMTLTSAGIVNITGAANSIVTGTGQILNINSATLGTSGIAFQTLTSGTVASGNAINLNNLDAAGAGTFSGGAVTIGGTGGAAADGINITNSNSTFGFASATIDNTTGDGIEINGTSPNLTGAVTFTTVNLDGMTGSGINIVGATNAVNINGGTIGSTNDPGADAVVINGGTGAVTIAASITKTTLGNEAVDISTHSGGAISFTGTINANSGGGGIRLVNNTGGNIGFSGDVTLNTGSLAALTFTNTAGTGANVTFTEGSLDIDTTSGTGINATSTTVGAGSLTISGATGPGNIVTSTTGRAINIDGVTSNITLNEVNVTGGGTTTGVFLKNTGSGGQFIVTGEGSTAGSGGTIANIGGGDMGSSGAAATGGTGMYMENVSNVSLSNMNFTGPFTNFGIRGENVNNFTLTDSALTGTFGDNVARDEDTIRFGTGGSTTGLTGTALFQGNVIQGGRENNLSILVYGSNTLNLTIKDSASDQAVFGQNSTLVGAGHSFSMESGGTSNVTLNVTGVAFNGANGTLLNVTSIGSATQNLQITNNQFHNAQATTLDGGAGVNITGSLNNSNITYNIDGNSFKGTRGASIFSMFNGDSGNVNGIVNNNTFGTANGSYDTLQANYGSLFGGAFFGGIDSKFVGTGTINYALRISNNTIRDSGSDGVIMLRSASQNSGGAARLEVTISNNTIAEVGANVAGGIYAQVAGSGAAAGDYGKMGLNISNNNINVSAASFADAVYIDNGSSLNGLVYLPGYAGPANPFNEVSTYLTGKGNVFPAGSADSGTGGAAYNPGGALTGAAFTLAVPMMLLTPDVGNGWEDLEVSPVTAPPLDPDPVPTDDGDQTSGQGGETSEPADDDGSDGSGGSGSGSGGGGGTPPVLQLLTQNALDSMVDAAIQRWTDAGASAEQIAAMRAVDFNVTDMAGIFVGTSTNGTISIDSDGAGYGWFIDSTPGEDSEFEGSGTRLTADAGGVAEGRLDLLTVLIHELGHQIGLSDDYMTSEANDVMYGYANVGERRLPAQGEAEGAVPGSIGSTAFALTPVSVGTLPPNKTFDIFFKSTVDAQTDGFIVNWNNTATISGSNFANVLANEQLALDSLALGSTVYVDTNNNGLFDAGEGRVGVILEIYADTNDSGGWDAGDALLGNTTSGALGAYSFVGLAPGDYIVVITAANFANGAALDEMLIVPGVAADPDNNVDNDNNGVAIAGGAFASQTITLDYNTEPTAGIGNDTNNTLDFGFVLNQPPVANDDSVSVGEDSGANDLTAQLLANDTDPENDSRTITSATQGAHGTTSVVAGVLTYTPTGDYNGTDSFTYTIDDGNGHTDTATVNVTVTAVADIADDSVGVLTDSVDNALDLLANDSFENSGRAITAVGAALHGTTAIDDNGTAGDPTDDFVTYTPTAGYSGPDSFTYTVTSGGVMETATVTVNVAVADIAPIVDLDGDDSVGDGTSYASAYTEGGAAAPISDTDVLITDADAGDDIVSATITITNAEAGDKLNVGALPATVTVDPTSTDTVVKLVAAAGTSAADFEAAIEAITFSNTGDNPTDGGTNVSRAITVVVNDGQLDSNAATATIAITGVNDGPANNLGSTIGTIEDAVQAWLSGMSISDPDSGGSDIRVTLHVGHGILDILTNVAGGVVAGDVTGNGTDTIVVVGSQSEINATLAAANGLTYTPTTNFNGADSLTVTTNDLGANGTDPGLTGDGTSEETASTRTITVQDLNDAPTVIGDGTEELAAIDEDTPSALGQSVFSIVSGQYSDAADAQFGVGNPTGSSPGSNAGVAVVANSSSPATGEWQYFNTTSSAWVAIGTVSAANALLINVSTNIRFVPAQNYEGTAPSLTVHLIDNSLPFGITFGQFADISGAGATGGTTAYSTATVTISQPVTAVNDPPAGTDNTLTVNEDGTLALAEANFDFTDPDSGDVMSAVIITSVTGGKIFFDSDGAGGADPVEVTVFPTAEYSVADLALGKLTFRPNANLNGDGAGSIGFQVVDDSGAVNDTDLSANTLTINVTAANDSPVLTTGGPIAATEQTAVAILTAGSVSDVDLDARNGGNGDYAGASFSVNRNPATNAQDVFTLVAGPNFTIVGNELRAGGLAFATISVDGSAGLIVISFTSLQTAATSALVDEVIQSVRYTNTSDSPPASVDLAVGFSDGSPGGGQGPGATNLDVNLVTVNITDTTESPIVDLNGAPAGDGVTLNYTENQTAQKIAPAGTLSDLDSANFQGGVLTMTFTAGGSDDDRLVVIDQGFGQGTYSVVGNEIYYDFGSGVDGDGNPILDPRLIGTFTGGNSGSDPLAITLTSDATVAITQGLLRLVGYFNVSESPSTVTRNVTYTLSDESGNTSNPVIAIINVTAVVDGAVANDDSFFTDENVPVAGNVFNFNGGLNDYDPDGNPLQVTAVNGSGANVGVQITLASGAKVTLNDDGTMNYDPSGAFNSLVPLESGAANFFAQDSFTYTLNGQSTATVYIGLNGVISAGDIYKGDSGDNTITGTPEPDFFLVNQGGDDDLSGLGSNDLFLFGSTLTSNDKVDGGEGIDQIAIQGNYSGGLTLGTGIVSVESLALMPGNDTRFGDLAGNIYDYSIITVDENVVAGGQMVVDGARLRAGEDLTFNGSAETNGSFFIYGGLGTDNLTGGAQNDVFFFGELGQWGISDVANGGPGGTDQLALRGDYTITFGASQLIGIESIALVSAVDTRFGDLGLEFDYALTMNNANVAAGQLMTIDAATLGATETLAFNGSAETNGAFRVFGGASTDVLTGGSGNDILVGGLRGDTLTGGAGNDTFVYRSTADSNSVERDGIQDFNAGDIIDLSQIDANTQVDGNQAFDFIGPAAFGNVAGQLRFENISLGGPIWLIQGDTDGNGVSDFELVLVISPADPITASDFIL